MINIQKMAGRRDLFFKYANFLFVGLFLVCVELTHGFTSAWGGAGETQTVRCIDRERQALLLFKQDLVDDHGRLSSWGSEEDKSDCCKWSGVTCNNRTGHVIFLDLHGEQDTDTESPIKPLGGKVSASLLLLELHHLKHLDLSLNEFENIKIPDFIGSFPKLTYLNLSFNSFVGEVPPQIGNLTNLRSLDLGYNGNLNATNLEWISHMLFLRYLDLSTVSLSSATDWLQAISSLSSLVELHLRACQLPLPILHPSLLSANYSSRSLSILDLTDNGLTSTPTYYWLFNLSSSLTRVNLSYNSLRGPIPDAFGSMVSLVDLDLGENDLDGEVPKSFGNLSSLRSFSLFYNNLSQPLPEFFENLSEGAENSLEILELSGNQFSGSIPDITRFSSLKILSLAGNQLNGSFSESVGQLSRLEILDLSSNQLDSNVTETHFAILSNLKELRLSFNSLTLHLNPSWTPPFQLDVIRLAYCKMGPHFPKWLQTQNNFSDLDISAAAISDTVPSWLWDLSPRLEYLNMSYNDISGTVPDLSKSFTGSAEIDLSFNRFGGTIPPRPPRTILLHLSNNIFTGSISFLCAINEAWFYKDLLLSLDLSNNHLSGEIPDCWMPTDFLTVLNLANNSFSGNIPSSLGLLRGVQMLLLSNNNLTGEFPSSLKNCKGLEIIDASENKLTGKIPDWLGTHLDNLVILSLRLNEFNGSIPPNLCHLQHIQVIDLSQNRLSGNIPNCFHNFTSLVQRNSSSVAIKSLVELQVGNVRIYTSDYMASALVQWKGQESEYGKTLGLLKIIDLSSNRLVGEIPEGISSLVGLLSLNLSRNNLTGNIIQNIGGMQMLESLDLSKNHLSGEIPSSLANIYSLGVLDLSNNSLSGKIPISTQLQSFNTSSYSGNGELCGLPLPKCPGDETAPLPPTNDHKIDDKKDEDDDWLWTSEFYMSMGIGFFVGFWTIFGSILFKDSWRQTYFKSLNDVKEWIYLQIALCVARLRRKLEN